MTSPPPDILHKAVKEVWAVANRLLEESGNRDDEIAIAVVLTKCAEEIYLFLGGPPLAAAQFKRVANRLARTSH